MSYRELPSPRALRSSRSPTRRLFLPCRLRQPLDDAAGAALESKSGSRLGDVVVTNNADVVRLNVPERAYAPVLLSVQKHGRVLSIGVIVARRYSFRSQPVRPQSCD